MAEHEREFSVGLRLEDDYRFTVDFGVPGVEPLLVDEPEPLGGGAGPNPARLLGTAVANCLAASLLFCLRRSRVDVHGMEATVHGTMERNEKGRYRITAMRVVLQPGIADGDRERMGRCLDIYEEFCIVTQSVRDGLDVEVVVEPLAVVPA
jgi:uncharacterized OsmC-like protein